MNAATPPESPLAVTASPLYRWEVPDKSISIYLSLDVVDRIEHAVLEAFRSVTSRGLEIGGVLLGRSAQPGKRVVIVESFEVVTCDYARGPLYLLSDADRKRLEETLARRKEAGPLSVIGFFRGNTRRDIALEDDDLAVINTYFADPASVFLLVKPSARTPSTGAFFFRDHGELRTESSYLPFPFKRAELEKSFAHQLVAPEDASAEVASPPKAAPAPPAPPPKREDKKSALERLPVSVGTKEPLKPAAAAVVLAAAFARQNDKKPAPAPYVEPERPPALPVPVNKDERRIEMPPPAMAEPVVRARMAAAPAPPGESEKPPLGEPAAPTFPPLFGELPPPAPGMLAPIASRRWFWTAVVVLVLAAVGYLTYIRKVAHPSRPVETASDTLDLKVEQISGVALLSWNWWSSVIRTAERATLTINDGDHREDIDLDLGQLRTGRVVYTAKTNDVSFRLEVTDLKHRKTQSDTVRVLARRPWPITPMLQPKPPETQKPTRAAPARQTVRE